ncbi:MAG TPA: hypothetical protein VFK02_02705, partial [Kofleriaceae bacterium]|nr:hypothetical protein [Kofleriaceae bacterium]
GDRATRARWIVLDGPLAWGPEIELPEPLAALALAPGGRRIAGIGRRPPLDDDEGVIVDLAGPPAITGEIWIDPPSRARTVHRGAGGEPPIIGFSDDDTAVVGVAGHLTWASLHRAAWSVDRHRPFASGGLSAIADRVVAAGTASLHLPEASRVRFLGYAFLGDGRPFTEHRFHDGGGVLLEVELGRLWIDRELRVRPPVPAPGVRDLELVLDDHHLLFLHQLFDQPGRIRHRVMVHDVPAGSETEIAVADDVSVARYDPATHVLALASGDDIVRYRIGFDPLTATPLRTLARAGALKPFYLTDPALAHGVVAVVDGLGRNGRARIYRIPGEDRGPPVAPEEQVLAGPIAAVDRAGSIYVASRGISVHRDVPAGPAQRLPGVPAITALSHDGAQIAVGYGDVVRVLDVRGAVRWTTPVWHAGPVAWSLDDQTLFIAAEGGATISLDAATGARIAMRCGWAFGLFDRDVAQSTNTPSACAVP